MSESAERRRPGRPPGHPKTGGRRPGSPRARLPEELRGFINQRGRPLELLAAISDGRKVSAADPSDPSRKIRIYPTLDERVAAARSLLDRLLPTLKATEAKSSVTVSGSGPAPLSSNSSVELARQVAFLLAEGAQEPEGEGRAPSIIDSMAEDAQEPPQEAPAQSPVGKQEQAGAWTLRLVDVLPDGRERWVAYDQDEKLAATAFSRDALVAQLPKEQDD
ncbi:MAG: hypothetical protein ACQEUZ_01875 [Pseudomonadota bacterium]